MRLKELKELLYSPVCIFKDNGQLTLEKLYEGILQEAPVYVLGLFIAQIWTLGYDNIIRILIMDLPFD